MKIRKVDDIRALISGMDGNVPVRAWAQEGGLDLTEFVSNDEVWMAADINETLSSAEEWRILQGYVENPPEPYIHNAKVRDLIEAFRNDYRIAVLGCLSPCDGKQRCWEGEYVDREWSYILPDFCEELERLCLVRSKTDSLYDTFVIEDAIKTIVESKRGYMLPWQI